MKDVSLPVHPTLDNAIEEDDRGEHFEKGKILYQVLDERVAESVSEIGKF